MRPPTIHVKIARRTGTLKEWCWYDRINRHGRSRAYHVFSVDRIATSKGHFWRIVIGPLAIAVGWPR